MKYYAIQVKTGSEDRYIQKASQIKKGKDETVFKLIFPRRRLNIRRQGAMHAELSPLFPGYVFLETEELTYSLFLNLRSSDGFYRFLKNNQDVTPLEGRDLATLKHFIGFGEIAEPSKVFFDEDDRITVIQGPLKGLEGCVVRVDKRKGRAKIKLDFYEEHFLLDLAFEVMGKADSDTERPPV